MLLNGIRGFRMAVTDSVPGVSGGTTALLFGLYDEFIDSPSDLMGKDNVRRKQAPIFLLKLGIGWTLGLCLPVPVLSGLSQDYTYEINFVLMGLTLLAIPVVIREERHSMKGRYDSLVFTFVGVALVFCISYFNSAGRQGINVSVEHLPPGLAVYMFIAAMMAIAAMVLPGIPGSTLLLIFSIYVPIVGAVKEFLHMNLDHVPILAVFGLGVITDIVGVIKLIKLCLERYRSQAICTIMGLMIGPFYAIIMGPTTLDVPRDPMGLDTFRILFFLLGSLILAKLEFMKIRLEKQ